jgi:flavin reductase (DIM6/NTAB) family NADH-FMN oxidoreductase RutF
MSDPFTALVAAMDTAMVVVTTAEGGEGDGCLVGFHSQCSIDPPRYAVWLSVANRTHELAQRATHLAVHLLTEADGSLAERFGSQTGDEVDKLAGLDWEPGPGGGALQAPAPARMVGRLGVRLGGGADPDQLVRDVVEAGSPSGRHEPLRLSAVTEMDPGHEAEERR